MVSDLDGGSGGALQQVQTLREAAEGKFLIGAAVAPTFSDHAPLRKLIAEQFSTLTPENVLKPQLVQPVEGEFDFGPADLIVDFAQAHEQAMIGHTFVWYNQTPDWFFHDRNGKPDGRDAALRRLHDHIEAVAGRYRGRIHGWDVVNEAVADGDGFLRDTTWRRAVGDDYIEQAFRFAAAADPDARLYYNDYNMVVPAKRAKAIRLIRELRAAGVRVDGVGLQGHYRMDWPEHWPSASDELSGWPMTEALEQAICEFAAEGLEVMITELDVNILPGRYSMADAMVERDIAIPLDPFVAGCSALVLQAQAEYYAGLFRVMVMHADKISRVTFWGVYDGHTWLNNWPIKGRTNHPLLFDRELKPKPAYFAVLRELQE